MDTTALIQSGILTLVGMLVVFLFMGLLIGIMHAFLALAYRFFPEKPEGNGDAPSVSLHQPQASEHTVVAAIATAVLHKQQP